MACIDTRLFDDFFRYNNNLQESFVDFLEYVSRDSSMVEKNKDGKIVAVCAEIDIDVSCFYQLHIRQNLLPFKKFTCENIVFKEKVKFDKCEFKGKVSFKNCTFKKQVIFSNSSFEDNVYFNNSTFEDYADFHECKFEKTACFYGVGFEGTPNFSQALFKSNLNLVNTNLNFDFEDLELRIQNELQSYKENKGDNDKKSLENFTNDFRDSFRNFKAVLLKEHNTLDALDFHKAEFYCKEIELKQKWHKKGVEATNDSGMRKNTLKFKEVIDFCLLYFYRKLCEHHTDFLRVFNNLILLIALYATIIYIGGFIDDEDLTIKQISNFTNYFVNVKDFFADKPCFLLVAIPALLACCVFYILFICLKNYKDIWKVIKQIFSKSLMMDLYKIFCFSLFILFISAVSTFFVPKDINTISIFLNIYIFLLFPFLYLWLLSLNNILFRYLLIICAYFVALIIIGFNKIALLNPFIGKFVSDKVKVEEPLFILITFAYTILMALVLFSLQKTARKNSIIPS